MLSHLCNTPLDFVKIRKLTNFPCLFPRFWAGPGRRNPILWVCWLLAGLAVATVQAASSEPKEDPSDVLFGDHLWTMRLHVTETNWKKMQPSLPARPSSDTSSTETALHFIAGFWEAMVREWAGIDRLR